MRQLKQIYSKLHSHFGPRYWWPTTKDGELTPDYHKKIAHSQKQKLEICFGAILTQNTSWKNVEKAITHLNKEDLINIQKIKKIKKRKLARIIRSSGYHNQKARKLKEFCSFISKIHKGSLKNFFEKDEYGLRNEMLSIHGIGPETADSIILYAAKKPIFVIDAYTQRIMGRMGFKERSYRDLQELFMENLEHDEKLFNQYHALLVALGKNYCKKNDPLCQQCPLRGMCAHGKQVVGSITK